MTRMKRIFADKSYVAALRAAKTAIASWPLSPRRGDHKNLCGHLCSSVVNLLLPAQHKEEGHCLLTPVAPKGRPKNPLWPVAVGMPVARHPPHRSRRAGLPHRAPASGQTQSRSSGYGCKMRTLGIHVSTRRMNRDHVKPRPF